MRLGRALQRKQARLVILDEPFRGVDSLEVRRARKALAPITSSSAFYSKMATTRRISLPLPYPEPSPSVVLAKPTRLWWNAKSGRSRLNHDVAIVERRSFDRAKTNLVEQDAVLGDAALRSIHCEHQGVCQEVGVTQLEHETAGTSNGTPPRVRCLRLWSASTNWTPAKLRSKFIVATSCAKCDPDR